jgi:hypothetical protein
MDKVTIVISWEEYETMISAIKAMKNMVDSDKLDQLYVKLYIERKVEKGK